MSEVRLWRRILSMVSFGRTTAATVESDVVARVQTQFSALQSRNAVEHLQHYGFASALPIGTDVVVVHKNGDPSHAVIIASGHQTYRPLNLNQGAVCLYDDQAKEILLEPGSLVVNGNHFPILVEGKTVTVQDDHGSSINLSNDGTIHLAGTVSITGTLIVNGVVVTVP